ncbi:eukaryotic translation initiation factor 3 62 kDa subunit [Armillaria novae-zelandiae]|uniref:tRNA (adenine(58)-N(1))-methyltransferase non-catalytic subunit TRM6 n=1 Tax=Armillaria novae-zelandiae TaxID=153914 RepID=A0AA39PEB4_9AGAR|nr:eukaryotic translation initiation factor 3 62 kDa subunit [Armillaria novae-zelandiae]
MNLEDTDATNELINDGESVQPLTVDEINALKQSGVHSSDIINKQIEAHANYSLKTEYSKEKYKKRKEAKYSKTFTTIEPTLFNVCDYWFQQRPDPHTPGGRYIAVDDASGLVVCGVLSRMGGEGRLITICDTDSPPAYPVMAQMNFDPKSVSSVLSSLNWATAQEDYTPVLPPSEVPAEEIKSERQKTRLKKRKIVIDALASTREELFAGEFDGLIIASDYAPWPIVQKLTPYISGSASIVVQSPYCQILDDLQNEMRGVPSFLCPTVTEGMATSLPGPARTYTSNYDDIWDRRLFIACH